MGDGWQVTQPDIDWLRYMYPVMISQAISWGIMAITSIFAASILMFVGSMLLFPMLTVNAGFIAAEVFERP